MVRDSRVQPSGNVTTTYDKLIQNYADLHAKLIDATIAQGKAQEILDIYADVTQNTDPAVLRHSGPAPASTSWCKSSRACMTSHS